MTDSVYATAPFDHAKADIILRSSDNTDFRVFKFLLSLASPFFETLFEIPQPAEAKKNQEVKDGLVVIPVAEDSKTLDTLLRFCYPCTLTDDPKLEVLKDAVDVLEAAGKYSLDGIEKKTWQAISKSKFLEVEPFRCFAIAHRGHLREETLLAAKHTLTEPLIPSRFEEIGMITAADLLALLAYHRECGEAVYSLRTDLSWITSNYARYNHFDQRSTHCNCPRVTTSKYMKFCNQSHQWWEDFIEEVFTALRDQPCKATVRAIAEKTVRTVRAQKCPVCSHIVNQGMIELSDLFGRKIEGAVSQIEMQLEF